MVLGDAFGNALGNSIVGAIQYSNQQEKLRSTLDKAGVKYAVDADDNLQADPSQRASFSFVQGALSSGATPDQVKGGLGIYGSSIVKSS